jgi:two-component system, cell cycle response regulator DivK
MKSRVLVVDDNPMNAHLAKLMLGRAGFEAHTVESAQRALEYLEGNQVDVVVTDISMPEMSGKDLCRAVHERFGNRRPRVVAFTAFAMEHQKQSIMEAGFDALIVKPVTASALVAAVCGAPDGTPCEMRVA